MEHFTGATLETTHWCNQCWRLTQHEVSNGRMGRCLEHEAAQFSKKQLANRERIEREQQNPTLFEKGGM